MSLLPEKILKELVSDEFKGQPRIMQIDAILKSLFEAEHKEVSPRDISEIFKEANMRCPKNQKKIRCGAFKVTEILKSISAKKNASEDLTTIVKEITEDKYEISLRSVL